MHGAGKFVYASGNVYDGTWDNGVYQGNGSYVWPDGRRYEVITAACLPICEIHTGSRILPSARHDEANLAFTPSASF